MDFHTEDAPAIKGPLSDIPHTKKQPQKEQTYKPVQKANITTSLNSGSSGKTVVGKSTSSSSKTVNGKTITKVIESIKYSDGSEEVI